MNSKKIKNQLQLRRIRTLQYLNSTLSDMSSGWLINTRILEKLKKKNNINLHDVEDLKELKSNWEKNQNHLQDTGEFRNFECQRISLDKISEKSRKDNNKNNNDEEANQSSSSYRNKVVVSAGDIQIILKTKD